MGSPNPELRRRLDQRGWYYGDLVQALHEAAAASRQPMPQVDSRSVSRWVRGWRQPGPYYTRLLCQVFGASAAELGLARRTNVPADSSDLGPEEETWRLAGAALGEEGAIEEAHEGAHRLCRAYSGTAPADLLPQVQQHLRLLLPLLQRGLSKAQHDQLLTDSAWLYLLLAAAHNDLGQRQAAWASRDAALALGQKAGDGNVVAWAHETPAWFYISDRRAGPALEYASAGRRLAPEGSSGWIMTQLKVVQAQALLGDRLQAERGLEEAQAMLQRLPEPTHPDHHFVFDPPKLRFYAGTAYAWLGLPELAEANAREVIRTASDRNTDNWVPSRVGYSRLDLAQALLLQGRLDEASAEASRVFDTLTRRDTLVRADEVRGIFQRRYPREPATSAFHKRYEEAVRQLPGRI